MESACSFRPMELFTKANFLKICGTAVGVCGSIQGPHILVTVYLLAHLIMHPDVSTLGPSPVQAHEKQNSVRRCIPEVPLQVTDP